MKNNKRFILPLLLVGIYLISTVVTSLSIRNKQGSYDVEAEQNVREYVEQTQIPKITTQQGLRNTHYDQVTVFGQLICFSYTKHSCVDAYDFYGDFQFSIIVPDYPTGTVGVCSKDNRLFLFSKVGILYILDSTGIAETMSRKDAAKKGYTTNWCRKKNQEQNITVGQEHIIIYTANGDEVAQIKTPAIIAGNLPLFSLHSGSNAWIIICGFAVLIACAIVLVSKSHNQQKTQMRRLHEP